MLDGIYIFEIINNDIVNTGSSNFYQTFLIYLY